jgi:tRNA threonylcarbamoyl adenosine modification protein YeaZ
MELALDTSTAFASIALSDRGEATVELTWHSGQNHSRELIPNITYLLDQSNIDSKAIKAVFVAIGPGSFNGIRVGISTAKGLAMSLNIPVIGISSMEIEAYPFACTKLPLCPIHSAGRNEIAAALYIMNEQWTRLKEEHITTIDTLCKQVKQKTLFCGEIPDEIIHVIEERLGELAIIPEFSSRLRRASYLASLGYRRLVKNEIDNPIGLQPLYLRPPSITKRKIK